jgi:hypothetical protein
MSAFDVAKLTFRRPQSMSLSGVKQTCLFALHMSAFDPKRTSLGGVTQYHGRRTNQFASNCC